MIRKRLASSPSSWQGRWPETSTEMSPARTSGDDSFSGLPEEKTAKFVYKKQPMHRTPLFVLRRKRHRCWIFLSTSKNLRSSPRFLFLCKLNLSQRRLSIFDHGMVCLPTSVPWSSHHIRPVFLFHTKCCLRSSSLNWPSSRSTHYCCCSKIWRKRLLCSHWTRSKTFSTVNGSIAYVASCGLTIPLPLSPPLHANVRPSTGLSLPPVTSSS